MVTNTLRGRKKERVQYRAKCEQTSEKTKNAQELNRKSNVAGPL